MSAWVWKDEELKPINPSPDAGVDGAGSDYTSCGYAPIHGVELCYELWQYVGPDVVGKEHPPLKRYRYIVLVGSTDIDTIFVEDLPDWLTLQPYLAAMTQLAEASMRDSERQDKAERGRRAARR